MRLRAALSRAGSSARCVGVVLALLASAIACGPQDPQGPAQPVDPGVPAPSGGAGGGGGAQNADAWSNLPPSLHTDVELAPLGVREATRARVCERARGDQFAKALCGTGSRPRIADLAGLLALAGLDQQRAFALTGNSTSLVSMSVSAVNPRILVFPRVADGAPRRPSMTSVGFVRGEQFVEIVSRDELTDDLNFYLLAFEQACSYQPNGCDLASLLTEEIEHGWTAYSVYDQDDLEGTSFDCLSCHQPGGHGTKRMLRMQELSAPWMHWFPQRFVQRTETDRVLGVQFAEAHRSDAQYGGVPIATITNALDEGSGAQLEALLRAEGFAEQPNPFDAHIAAEMKSGTSATWQSRFDAHLRGEAIAVPFPSIDVTDAALRTAAVQSYLNVIEDGAPRESLIDLRRVFSRDAEQKLSFVPQPGADGRTVLQQMCARCHDGRGNPALRKNQFNVLRLAEMPRALKDLAIERIDSETAVMPPKRAGYLPPEAKEAAKSELRK